MVSLLAFTQVGGSKAVSFHTGPDMLRRVCENTRSHFQRVGGGKML